MIKKSQKPKSNEYPVLGFRKWQPDTSNNMLLACTNKIPWQPGNNYAAGCSKHAAPGENCHCGLNAWFSFKGAKENYQGVLGAIAGAGRIELHEQGFRAEQAQIIALFASNGKEAKNLQTISKKYSIPVFQNKEKFLAFVQQYAVSAEDLPMEDEGKDDFVLSLVLNKKEKLKNFKSFLRGVFHTLAGSLVFAIMVIVDQLFFKGQTYGEIRSSVEIDFLLLSCILGTIFFSYSLLLNKHPARVSLISWHAGAFFCLLLVSWGAVSMFIHANNKLEEKLYKEKQVIVEKQIQTVVDASLVQAKQKTAMGIFVVTGGSPLLKEGSLYAHEKNKEGDSQALFTSTHLGNQEFMISAVIPDSKDSPDHDGAFALKIQQEKTEDPRGNFLVSAACLSAVCPSEEEFGEILNQVSLNASNSSNKQSNENLTNQELAAKKLGVTTNESSSLSIQDDSDLNKTTCGIDSNSITFQSNHEFEYRILCSLQ